MARYGQGVITVVKHTSCHFFVTFFACFINKVSTQLLDLAILIVSIASPSTDTNVKFLVPFLHKSNMVHSSPWLNESIFRVQFAKVLPVVIILV